MYRRPKSLEKLLDIRRSMALEADYDVAVFAEIVRNGSSTVSSRKRAVTRVVTEVENSLRRTPITKINRRSAVKK
jgi:hypothetical protein